RFGTYLLTSWIAMLPGAFLYVYLGQLGRAGLEVAAGGERSRSPLEWTLLVVGLLATVAVTVYVTRLARRALREQTGLEGATAARPDAGPEQPAAVGWPWGTTVVAAVALALL